MSKNSYHLDHEGLARPVLVKKSPRAKRMTLRVSPTKRDVILTVPRNIGPGKAEAFVNKHLDWLNRQIEGLPDAVPFAHGALVPLEGQLHRLDFAGPRNGAKRGQPVIEIIKALSPNDFPVLRVIGDKTHAPRRLVDWLKKRAHQRIGARVEVHCKRLGLEYSRLGVRDQTSRWGSCSSSGALSFSWRLILAPSLVLDYVAAHEVAHLQEMNHSPRFWKLVAQTMPECDSARQWLRQNGQDLHRYGADV